MNLKQLKTKYKAAYQALPSEIACKSLNTTVKRTKSGFQHVFTNKIRTQIEISSRGNAIKHLVTLIESINIYQDHEKHFRGEGLTEYWNLQGVVNGVCIHLTIRKIGAQEPHLYSWHYKGISPKIKGER